MSVGFIYFPLEFPKTSSELTFCAYYRSVITMLDTLSETECRQSTETETLRAVQPKLRLFKFQKAFQIF